MYFVDSEDPVAPLPPTKWLLPLQTHLPALELLLSKIPELIPRLQGDPICLGSCPSATEIRDAILATHGSTTPNTSLPTQAPIMPPPNTFPRHTPTAFACTTAVVDVIASACMGVGAFVFVFASSHASCGLGKLGSREGAGLYGTDNEICLYGHIDTILTHTQTHKLTQAQSQLQQQQEIIQLSVYKELINKCSTANVAVFTQFFSLDDENFIDVAPLADVCDGSGGYVHTFRGDMLLEENAFRLTEEICSQIEMLCGKDAIIKLRLGEGLTLADNSASTGALPSNVVCSGRFLPIEEEIELACVHQYSTLMFQLKVAGDLPEDEPVYAQLACLYMDIYSMRRVIRVHNYVFYPTKHDATLYRYVDVDCLLAYYAKHAVCLALTQSLYAHSQPQTLPKSGPQQAHTAIGTNTITPYNKVFDAFVDMLFKYRLKCAPNSGRSKLVIPDSVRYAPFYFLGLHKHMALIPNALSEASCLDFRQVTCRGHVRALALRTLKNAPVREVLACACPHLYALHAAFDAEDTVFDTQICPFPPAQTPSAQSPNQRVQFRGQDAGGAPSYDVSSLLHMPRVAALSSEFMQSDGVYVCDDGETSSTMYLFLGRQVALADLQEWFGSHLTQRNMFPSELHARPGSVIGTRIMRMIEFIRHCSPHKQGEFSIFLVVVSGLNR
jgi:hypothetical protein